MMTTILIIVVILSCIVANKLYSSVLNPISVFIGVNVFSIALSILQNNNFEYTIETIFAVFIMFFSFIIGIVLGVKKGFKRKALDCRIYTGQNLKRVIFTFGIIYDIALTGYLHQLFSTYSIADFFLKMNEVNAYVQSDKYSTHWYFYVIPLGTPILILCIFYLKNFEKNILVICQAGLSVLYCVSPRRDSLFNLIIISLFFFLSGLQDRYRVKNISMKIIRYSVVVATLVVFLMGYTQQLLNKETTVAVELKTGELPRYLNDSYLYISLNYPYFQNQNLDYLSLPDYPFLSTFRLGYIIINRVFGTDIDLQTDFSLEFDNVGSFTTNTSPILYYSILDLGFFFFLFFVILGFLSQRAYYSLNSNKVTNRIIGAICFTILALSFRGYLLIYLTFVLSLIYSLIINKFLRTSE